MTTDSAPSPVLDSSSEESASYVEGLLESYSETNVREILKALSTAEDFIPAQGLRAADLETAPLEDILSPELPREMDEPPLFVIEAIREKEDGIAEVDVAHGVQLAGRGETFVLEPTENGY